MKHGIIALLLILLLMIIGCKGEHRYPQSLLAADSLSNVNPDSAIRVLQALGQEMVGAPEPDQKYYQLLTIKAKDKAYQSTVSTDSIETLLRYYEDGGDKKLLSTAYYYAGRVYSDAHDAPTALSYYQKSLDAMQDNDLQLKSVIYSQMGYLFLYQYLFVEAEQCFNDSYRCGEELNDTLDMLYAYRDLAITYLWQNKYDLCLETLKKGEKMASVTTYDKMKVQIAQHTAGTYVDLKDYAQAKKYMQLPIEQIEYTDSSSVYNIMMKIYDGTNNVDSVLYYADGIQRFGSVYARQKAAKFLTAIFNKQGKSEKTEAFFRQYLQLSDSITNMTKTAELQRALSAYNYQKKDSEKKELQMSNTIKEFALCLMVILIIASVVISYLIYLRRREAIKGKIRRINELQKARYKESEAFIKENDKKIEELQSQIIFLANDRIALEDDIRKKTGELEKHKAQLESLNAIAQAFQNEHKRAAITIRSSSIHSIAIKKAEINSILNENDWNQAEEIILSNYPDFRDRLWGLHNFSKQEYRVTLLLKLQIEPAQIATLTAHTKSAITQTRTRLYKKCFGTEGSADQWDEFVNSL